MPVWMVPFVILDSRSPRSSGDSSEQAPSKIASDRVNTSGFRMPNGQATAAPPAPSVVAVTVSADRRPNLTAGAGVF